MKINQPPISRRTTLKTISSGFGYLAFAAMAQAAAEKENKGTPEGAEAAAGPLDPKAPHFKPRAKRVIFLCMQGGPSHVDTFDYKPKLAEDAGKPAQGGRARGGASLMGSMWDFKQHGQSGLYISELFPNVAGHADELCVLNGMHTDIPNHPQAFTQMHTGSFQFVRPSLGAWTLYGLGTENENLPGFVTISPPSGLGGSKNYGSSFLPAVYQGTRIGQERLPLADASVPNISNARLSKNLQRIQLDLIKSMNLETLHREKHHPEVEGVIESFELGFRMQDAVPEVMDISDESAETLELYGIKDRTTENFGRQCLLARRFAEEGVRFIEVGHGNWDQHRNLKADLERNCSEIDKPISALLTDLERRDMLDDTLVIWGGEFGRTPHSQGSDGRDHNNKGFSMWMAGGGVKGGMTHGMTDDYGYEAVEGKVHIHDWHATILHLLGLDHERLTFKYAGRDFRLTDVYGNVVKEILS